MFSDWFFNQTPTTLALFVEMVVAGLIVIVSGARLTTLADQVADQYRLGDAWVGVILLATVTSLPEVVTGLTATWVGQAGMAFSAIFGSCSFNIILIVLLNAIIGGGSILHGKGRAHSLTSAFGIVLLSIALLGILVVGKHEDDLQTAGRFELMCVVVIAVTYMLCMRMVFRTERETNIAGTAISEPLPFAKSPLLLPRVGMLSLVLVASAWWMARTGDVVANHPIELLGGRTLGATFVGILFLALATSLPEVVTGLSAVRMGNIDMALGNIFGSNMFNIFVIPFLKIASLMSGEEVMMTGETFHAHQNLMAGVLPILLTGIVLGALSYRSDRRLLNRFGVDSALLAAIYLVGMMLILGGG